MQKDIESKIRNKEFNLGVIGLGYVGLPLAMAFVDAGFNVVGIDISENVVNLLNNGHSHIQDVSAENVLKATSSGQFSATTDFSVIAELDAVSVCVPTPLNKNQEPDVSHLLFSVDELGKNMKKPILITLESTTYPGSTRELFYEHFESINKKINQDYFLCFSPERIDPGNITFQTNNIPKVIGGLTPESSEIGKTLYEMIVSEVIVVSSLETAEMSKLLENTFRSVNIAFMNEMALMCERLNIDIWESADAAATKPFGFLSFYPGAGVGGHCIPLDPMYLYWKGKQSKFFNRFIELSQTINMNMPFHVIEKISDALNAQGKSMNDARILLVGVSYKANINDIRESPTLDIFELLREKHANVDLLDPYVSSFKDKYGKSISVINDTTCDFSMYDCVVILTKHEKIHYQALLKESKLVVDMCNTFKLKRDNLVRLGGGSINTLDSLEQAETRETVNSGK